MSAVCTSFKCTDTGEMYIDSHCGEFKAELKLKTCLRSLDNFVKTIKAILQLCICALEVTVVKEIQKTV